ncbi:hypothetical protein ACJJIE_00180 (plasmid) [Microbulbifer sp. TRSA001]|uniref:hypothetical protein n=1 Tax=Microbulbifer sp. TRSA001 TaxID=3243381 RepID=UPI004038FFC1
MRIKTEGGQVVDSIHIFAASVSQARRAAEAAGIPWGCCRYVRDARTLRGLRDRPVWFVRGWYLHADAYDIELEMERRDCYPVRKVYAELSVDFAGSIQMTQKLVEERQ